MLAELALLFVRVQMDLADTAVLAVDSLVDPSLGLHEPGDVLAVGQSVWVALGNGMLHLAHGARHQVLWVDKGTQAIPAENVLAGQDLKGNENNVSVYNACGRKKVRYMSGENDISII